MILSIILIIIIVLLLLLLKNINKKYKDLEKNLVDSACIKLNQRTKEAQAAFDNLSKNTEELSKQWEKFAALSKEQVQKDIDIWKAAELEKTQLEIDDCIVEMREESFGALQRILDLYEKERLDKSNELADLQTILDEYKQKQQTINEEINRRRALEEQTDFYRVVLDDEAIDDIELLQSVRKNLHHRENLDKLIYDNYVSKPVNEMIKRVLNGRAPSGIYKITRLNTGEIYIGKSTNIKERWQQHAKTAFNCGTIAHSILHTTMSKDGIENFTFEILEEVPKDALGAKEKYYIDFYGSKEYGLNEKAGG